MTKMQKDVVLLSFIACLQEHGSWCGETHIQKGTYFLQELLGVPLGFEYVLYKHGPYSFDLKDELTALVADSLLAVKPRHPYGPSILPGENSKNLLERFPLTREKFGRQAKFVADRLASSDVMKLERLATALFVTRQELPDGAAEERASLIHELKPHISLALAQDAVVEVDQLIADAGDVVFGNA
jgi:hypothetical protein